MKFLFARQGLEDGGAAWKVGLKVAWDIETPAVAVPMVSGEGYAAALHTAHLPEPLYKPLTDTPLCPSQAISGNIKHIFSC